MLLGNSVLLFHFMKKIFFQIGGGEINKLFVVVVLILPLLRRKVSITSV